MCTDAAVCGRRAQELLEAARQRDPRTADFSPFSSHSSAASHRSQLAPLPSMPERPEIPAMPQRPRREDLPALPEKPRREDLPQLPGQPQMPALPEMPGKPRPGDLPQLPDLPVKPRQKDLSQMPQSLEMPGKPRQEDLPQMPAFPEMPRKGDLPEMPPVPAMPHSPAQPQAPVRALHAPPRPRSQAVPEAHARASPRSPFTAALSPTGSRYLHSPATPDHCEGPGAFPPMPEFTPFPALPDMPPFSDAHYKALSTAGPAAVAPLLLSAGSPTDAEVLSCSRCPACSSHPSCAPSQAWPCLHTHVQRKLMHNHADVEPLHASMPHPARVGRLLTASTCSASKLGSQHFTWTREEESLLDTYGSLPRTPKDRSPRSVSQSSIGSRGSR